VKNGSGFETILIRQSLPDFHRDADSAALLSSSLMFMPD